MNGRNSLSSPSQSGRQSPSSKSSSRSQASPSKRHQMLPPATPSKQPGLRRSPKKQVPGQDSPVASTSAAATYGGLPVSAPPPAKRARPSEDEDEESVQDYIVVATRYITKAELQSLAEKMGSEAADAKRQINALRDELRNMRMALEAAMDEINSLWQEFKLLRDEFGALAE